MKKITLLPIDQDPRKNERFATVPACAEILDVYVVYYPKIGFYPPWIGYFAADEKGEIVGSGGYKGRPKEGRVEIAYATFKKWEGQGMGTNICRQLVSLSLQTDPTITITARTLPELNASCSILKKVGFICKGTVLDEEDGEVWEWEYQPLKG